MPRRTHEPEVKLSPKKFKVIEESCSLDASFCDDEALPPGIVFTDVLQKKWRIGKPIGRGSFGRIYLASDETDTEVTKLNARYVVKIEPHSNGPLFVEVHCLIRTAQVSKVKTWCQQNKQKRLGMPLYIASGSFTDENTGIKYRFLVLPRYDIDLQKIISRTKVLDKRDVLVIAIQILDVLEYLHNQGYTHSDIKSSNLMLGFDGNKFNKMLKPIPSYQKDNKQLVLLSRKHKKTKTNKSRTSNYYDDEDFIVRDRRSSLEGEEDNGEDNERVVNVKKKLSTILSDKGSRSLHRYHAFNLRQLSNNINYEDLNSSVCSDQSYQKLLDDFGSKKLIYASRKIHELNGININEINPADHDDIHKDAVLSQSNGQVYLLDYGLASKFLDSNGKHKDFGMDARKAHDGTLEYSSRDSHIGAHSRRSDLETLGYNLLDWLTGTLPWKTTEVLAEPDLVHVLKKNFMSDIKLLLKTCFKTEFYPQFMEKYLQYVTSLEFTDKPDYDYCRSLFRSELLKNGYPLDKDLCVNFAETPMSPMSRKLCYAKRFGRKNTPTDFVARNGIKKAYERENICSFENDLKLELLKQTLNNSSEGLRKPCTSRNFFISDADLVARLKKSLMPHEIFGKRLSPKNLRSKKKNITQRKGPRRLRNSIGKFGKFMGSDRQFSWAEILAGNPENIIRKERNPTTNDNNADDATCKYRTRKISNASSEISDSNSLLLQKDYFQNMNPTWAMKEVIANLKKKINGKVTKELDESNPVLKGYTPAMMKVYKMKEKRELKEKLEAIKKPNLEKEVPSTRCTRSMANKANQSQLKQKKAKEKISHETIKSEVVGNKNQKTQKSTKSIKRITQKPSNEEIINVVVENNNKTQKSPKNTKRSTKSTRNSKKEVEQTETPKSTTKVTKKRPRKAQVIINRRRLRSSKRKKQSNKLKGT